MLVWAFCKWANSSAQGSFGSPQVLRGPTGPCKIDMLYIMSQRKPSKVAHRDSAFKKES